MKFNLYFKVRQLIIYLKPRDMSRYGRCLRCGACCEFGAKCVFLKYDDEGMSVCRINKIKPYTCSKYPLNLKEHHTREICGFEFPSGSGEPRP
jgi:uncharacterized protein